MGKWMVIKNPNMGETPFAVCSKKHEDEPLHSGNMIFHISRWFGTKEEAQTVADFFNREEEKASARKNDRAAT